MHISSTGTTPNIQYVFSSSPVPCPPSPPTNHKTTTKSHHLHIHPTPPHPTAQTSQLQKTPRTTHPVSHKPHAQKQLTSQPYAQQRCLLALLSAFMQMARFVHAYARRTRLALLVPLPLRLVLALALAETVPLFPAESTLVEEPIVLTVMRQS